MEYISIVALLVLGILMLTKPKLLWKIENFFTVKGGEPTDLYIAVMQLCGVFSIIASVVVVFSLLLKAI